MKKHLVSINDLPPEGKDFEISDQEVWEEPIKEFKMECKIVSPIHLAVHVQPADEGVLIRGDLKGNVEMPCNRCTEPAAAQLESKIEEYEEIPLEGKPGKDADPNSLIVFENHAPMLNLADLAWEQFMLALPPNPLCMPDCKGLCPQCGINLNHQSCNCHTDSIDPRMAPLAGVKIQKKKA